MLKVSIIVPVYNVAPYIIRCLDSIYNQSYPNIEVIIIDDCGCDDSMKIINSYLTPEKLLKTHIIYHNKNKGISAARNSGINIATGNYLYFIDSDDYITHDCIKSFVDIAIKFKNPDAIFGSATLSPKGWNKEEEISVDKEGIPEYSNDIHYIRNSIFQSFLQSLSTSHQIPIYVWNKLIKTNYIKSQNLYFKEKMIYEDLVWSWKNGNAIKSIAFNKKRTYFYQYSPNSITNTSYGTKNLDSEVIIIRELLKNINYKYLILQLHYILHYAHSSFCRRQGEKRLKPSYIRYPQALVFLIRCLFTKPEKLRYI